MGAPMILLLIPVAGIVLGLGLWVGLRGLGMPSMGIDRPQRGDRARGRDSGEGFTWRPPSFSTSSGGGGLREWADRMPAGCLIAVIAVTGLWIVGWLIFLIFGLNLLS